MLNPSDLQVLRELARQVREIADLPIQQQRIALWKKHNSLKGERPMLLVFPEGAWRELTPEGTLQCQGEQARRIEWELRARIYYHEHLNDDNPIHANLDVSKVVRDSGWGVQSHRIESPDHLGAWKFDPVVDSPTDLRKFKAPKIDYDEPATLAVYQQLQEALGDLLHVRIRGISNVSYHLMADWTRWRGLEQTMVDMIEAPEFVHEAMAMLVRGHQQILRQFIELNLLDLNNDYMYHGSGGNGWTDELPGSGLDGKRVLPEHMWASAESQELAEVSPCMHSEFALHYEKQLLKPFALNGYGCCEPLHHKLDDVLTIPRIRRISISPWADLRVSAAKLERKAIFSWKPMPAMLCGRFDEAAIRSYIRQAIQITRGCAFEMVLKDTHTIDHEPHRMHRWLQVAREEIDRDMQVRG